MSRYDGDEGVDPIQPYIAAFHAWENQVRDRYRIESDLAQSYMSLLDKFQKKCAECEREKRNATLWEKEQRMAERELNSLKTTAESAPFAFVVIDGDGAVFREDLIARAEEGGGEAAHELHRKLKEYFHENPEFANIDTILVHVALSVDGLSRALHDSGTLPVTDHTALTRFGRGFCRAQPLFSFTDVGYGKEQADHKVRKLFEVMERNIQCRCLILGGCHDNGYAPFLESFRGNQKICLLETTPPAADFRKFNYKRISIPTVFRSEPVPSKSAPMSAYTAPPTAPVTAPPLVSPGIGLTGFPSPATAPSPKPVAPPSIATSKPETQSNSYAAVGRGNVPLKINIASQKKSTATRPFIQLNKNDERVDVPLPKVDPNAIRALDERRQMNGTNFCNRYHLSNSCKNGANCNFYHGERLNAAEMLALRHKTRNLVCSAGHRCLEIGCNLGHHCPNPGSCYFGNDCRFSDCHGMDITPTIKIYEDESREVLN
ncbi:hypothetical protein MMYC01_203204 [Madurella mycetomatis]|uniref:C3H1-type domain-containing protein n=1 Tax=Madurella mycetomatis TaxID=100816 RepID=A0A175VWA4_9PEZI|nr:hypothetical protein MMYC01_208058 [Madurella mycetomatis]KXX81256.1 hypothetical protein MMYC01_203204 [Madurella mycetomatis]